MSCRQANDEHISFVLSNLRKHGAVEEGFPPPPSHKPGSHGSTRRRTVVDEGDAAVAAAAAGVNGFDLEEGDSNHYVDARRGPPKLKPRRGCCWVAVTLWAAMGIVFLVFAFQLHIHSSLFSVDESATLERRLARDESIRDELSFGVWDSQRSVTPLQLQVAVSMALGVRAEDDDIRVVSDENSFFKIEIKHATIEEAEFVASDAFISKLNTQLMHYNGNAVLSHPPKLKKNARREVVEPSALNSS